MDGSPVSFVEAFGMTGAVVTAIGGVGKWVQSTIKNKVEPTIDKVGRLDNKFGVLTEAVQSIKEDVAVLKDRSDRDNGV